MVKESRSEILKCRVSPDELLDIDEKAYRLGVTRSELLRRFIFEKEIKVYDFSALDELSYQIGKIGTNINQIAKKLNQGGELDQENGEFLKISLETINVAILKIYQDMQTGCEGGSG